jgi:hypothetical protein
MKPRRQTLAAARLQKDLKARRRLDHRGGRLVSAWKGRVETKPEIGRIKTETDLVIVRCEMQVFDVRLTSGYRGIAGAAPQVLDVEKRRRRYAKKKGRTTKVTPLSACDRIRTP